ncbi:MAG: hemerythrin domain-containing protein [Deltaproteobacteria bacterium]
MKSLEILKEEHALVERVLDLLERTGGRIRSGLPLPAGFESWGVEFLWHFGDHCHRAKHETSLFPLLQIRGISSDSGPVGVLLAEYKRARVYLERIRDAHDRRDQMRFALLSGEYAQLLRQHIATENRVLSQFAETCLSEEDDAELVERFHSVDHEQQGHELSGRYHAEIEDWEEKFREPVEHR